MPEQSNSLKPRLRALQSSLMVVGLTTIAILLFTGIAASAVWRAFSVDSLPPTPTIPANLESNVAYVSGQRGGVFTQPPGAPEATMLQVGDTVGAGRGALVRTGEDGWLRLGSQAGTFFLGAETEIELRQLGDERDNRPETILQLNNGIMLLVADPEASLRYIVFAETGARAETEDGMMGLTYDRSSQQFDLYCLEGPCSLVGREGETLELATGEHGWVQGFGEPIVGGPILYELFVELADAGLVPTATPLSGGVTPMIVPTPDLPTPTLVQLPPTKPPATFTPKPTLIATKTETVPAATATEEATPTAVASNTPLPTTAASATPQPTLPPASSTPLPTSTPLPATATSAPTDTLVPPTPTNTPQPTVTTTAPAGTATLAPTLTPPAPPG